MDNRVSVIGVAAYGEAALKKAVERHFDALGVWEDLRPGMRVALKPNLLKKNRPGHAVTTHPAVVEAVAQTLNAHGIREITLADSPGGPYTGAILDPVYTASGMREAAARAGFRLNGDYGFRPLSLETAGACREFNIINPVAEADFIINLPKLKTHSMTTLSAGVKNLFGCVPGLQKPELHFRFPEGDRFARMLLDLSLLVCPGVTLLDGVTAMEGDGPSGGEPRHTGVTFAARNVYALDLAACHFIGLSPETVPTVRLSIDAGLCPDSPGKIEWLCGGNPAPVRDFKHPRTKSLSFGEQIPPFLRGPLEWAERRFLSPRPAVAPSRCTGCRKCEESCAPKAIIIHNGKAKIDYDKCIRCYCCQEMCPVQAVRIRRTGILQW